MLKLSDLAQRRDFALGTLRISPSRREIAGPAGEVHVEPLVMQVLMLLCDANGEVVTRSRLFDECWGGGIVGDVSLNRAITMVRRALAETAPGALEIENIPRTGYRLVTGRLPFRRRAMALAAEPSRLIIAAAALALLGLAGWGWFAIEAVPRDPTVVVAPEDARSAELASGIANAAITTAASYQTPVRLLDGGSFRNVHADFYLRVRNAQLGAERKVELALFAGRDKSLVWSWSANGSDDRAGSLDALTRESGALVVTCAAETRASGTRPPDDETVKLYLDACSRFEPWAGADIRLLADSFEKVTRRAPRLGGAWSKLFLSKAEAIEGLPPVNLVDSLKQDLSRSRAYRIELPETYIAQAAVLPLNARFERLELYEAGLARYPRSLSLLSARSWQLRSVGRMDEAARTAGRAAELYPQSSAANAEYVNSLMHSGRIDAARNVLARAAKFAPEAPNLTAAGWVLEMRYGDPELALAMARSSGAVVETPMIAFLEARIHPTNANIDRAIAQLTAGYRQYPVEPGWLAQAFGAFGRTEEAIHFLLRYPYGGNSGDAAEVLFRPTLREVRRDPRFMQIARNFGVTDYWIRSGILPDFCYEPDLPYDCKEELAKLRKPPAA